MEVQASFVARGGEATVKHTLDYLAVLEKDGAFSGGWKGLDYGCGFGRFASLMLQYGPPEQLDLADAMPRVAVMVKELGLQNHFWEVPQILKDDTQVGIDYSFVFSYSVFTHFNKTPFDANFSQLVRRLAPGGTFYITVRQEDFLPHFTRRWFKSDTEATLAKFRRELRENHFFFVPIIDHPERKKLLGSCVCFPGLPETISAQGFPD